MIQSLTTSGEYDRSTINALSDEINSIAKTAAAGYSAAMTQNRIYVHLWNMHDFVVGSFRCC